MRASALLSMLCLTLLLSAPATIATGQEVPLALKFAQGDAIQYDVSFSGSGGLRGPDGQLLPLGVRGSLSLSQTVQEVLPDGSGRLSCLLPRADITVTMGGEQARFSCANGDIRWYAGGREHTPPEAPGMEKLPFLEVPILLTMAPNGRVTDFAFDDPALMAKLEQMAPPGVSLGRIPGTGDQMFPDEPMKVGETWRRVAQLYPLGPTMPLNVTISRTLDSYSESGGVGLAKMSGFAETRYQMQPMSLSPEADLSFSLPELRQSVTSTEFFDTTQGRLVRAEYDISLTARASVKAGESTQSGGFEGRMHVSVQVR